MQTNAATPSWDYQIDRKALRPETLTLAANAVATERPSAPGRGYAQLAGPSLPTTLRDQSPRKSAFVPQPKLEVGPVDSPEEREADRVAETAMREQGFSPLQADLQETIQCKLRSNGEQGSEKLDASRLESNIASVRSAGSSSLSGSDRGFFEMRLGHDFSDVRVHTGPVADKAAVELNARAFTVGHDVVFGSGRYAPETREGRQLLAHELTHVVQQGAAEGLTNSPNPAATAPLRVQRAPDGTTPQTGDESATDTAGGAAPATATSGPQPTTVPVRVQWFDASGKEVSTFPEVAAPGVHTIRFHRRYGSEHNVNVAAAKGECLVVWFDDVIGQGSIRFYAKLGTPNEAALRSTKYVIVTPTGTKSSEGNGKARPGGKNSEGTPSGEGGPEGKEGGKAGGSKYGYLGLLDMPPELTKLLEGAFEAFVDPQDYDDFINLVDLMRNIAAHGSIVRDVLADSDKLLMVLLGLDDSIPESAFTALEKWVSSPHAPRSTTRKGKPGGFTSIVKKLIKISKVIKGTLRPILTVRGEFRNLAQLLGVFMSMPGVEELLDAAGDKARVRKLGNDFAARVAKGVVDAFRKVAQVFEVPKLLLSNEDFVTRDDIGMALAGVAIKVGAKRFPGAGKLAEVLGAESLLARAVALAVPDEVTDKFNEVIGDLLGKATQAIPSSVAHSLRELGDTLEEPVKQRLFEVVESALGESEVDDSDEAGEARGEAAEAEQSAEEPGEGGESIMRKSADGAPGGPDRVPNAALDAMARSSGAPLAPKVVARHAATFGEGLLDQVRVHRDLAANEAAKGLNAKAFTHGSDIFFESGRFQPESEQGRRLLAHELAHVGQQARGAPPRVRRTLKEAREKFVEKFGVLGQKYLKLLVGPSTNRALAKVVEDALKKLPNLVGKSVDPKPPTLPTAYFYRWSGTRLRSKKPKSVESISRKLRYVRSVPPLTINAQRKIAIGSASGSRLRDFYMGPTPPKDSTVGRMVIERIRKTESRVRLKSNKKPATAEDVKGELNRLEVRGYLADKQWHPMRDMDMAHLRDAVAFWNSTGRKYGPRSDVVYKFMNNPNNYTLEYKSYNRSKGALLGKRYLPPLTFSGTRQ